MLELSPTRRSIRVAVALWFLTLCAGVDWKSSPAPDWHYGVIEPGSLERTANVYRFTLREHLGDSPRRLQVIYAGELPNTVCAGQDTMLEGVLEDGILTATSVTGPGCTKGFECRRWECLPDEQRPIECRRSREFQ